MTLVDLAFVREHWGSFKWRHHGAGLLQAYVSTNQRVHVWYSALLLPGMQDGGAVHNHRFGLESTVLCGRLRHTRLTVGAPGGIGPHDGWGDADELRDLWEIPQASNGDTESMRLLGAVSVTPSPTEVYAAGSTYWLDKWAFHWARVAVNEFAITSVTRHALEENKAARLLTPLGRRPVHAFDHEPDWSVLSLILKEARQALEDQAGLALAPGIA